MNILYNDRSIGKNYLTDNEIRATEYFFPERIDKYYHDITNNHLTVELRGLSEIGKNPKAIGKIVVYDLNKHLVNWSKNINFQLSTMLQYNDVLIQSKPEFSFRLDMETGKKLWEIPKNITFIDPVTGIGLGYPYSSSQGFSKRLEAFDMKDGGFLWYREIYREYGWNDLFHLNDSVILLASAGLHTINLRTGGGWNNDAITGTKNYDKVVMANAVGIMMGLVTGTYVVFVGHDIVTDVSSNILIDDEDIYFASKEKISSVEINGFERWSCILPKRETGKSSVFIQDSVLYMINYGYAFLNGHRIQHGEPFIAAFTRQSGRQLFLSKAGNEEEMILDFLTGNHELLLLYKDKVARYAMDDGRLLSETAIPVKNQGKLKNFIEDEYYTKTDSLYQPLAACDPDKLYVLTEKDQILTLNTGFDILDTAETNRFYQCNMSFDDMKFLVRDNETIIVDGEYRKIAAIEAGSNAYLQGTNLYEARDKTLAIIDLSEIFRGNR